ncbi:TPA: hypothetical protein ACH3X1_002935 [Trebouxia sp. C0004]
MLQGMYTQDQQGQVVSDILHSMRNADKSAFYLAFESAGSPDHVEAWVKERADWASRRPLYGFNIRPMINTYLVYWKIEGYPASVAGKPAWRARDIPVLVVQKAEAICTAKGGMALTFSILVMNLVPHFMLCITFTRTNCTMLSSHNSILQYLLVVSSGKVFNIARLTHFHKAISKTTGGGMAALLLR